MIVNLALKLTRLRIHCSLQIGYTLDLGNECFIDVMQRCRESSPSDKSNVTKIGGSNFKCYKLWQSLENLSSPCLLDPVLLPMCVLKYHTI